MRLSLRAGAWVDPPLPALEVLRVESVGALPRVEGDLRLDCIGVSRSAASESALAVMSESSSVSFAFPTEYETLQYQKEADVLSCSCYMYR